MSQKHELRKKQRRAWYRKNRVTVLEKQRAWYREHRNSVLRKQRATYHRKRQKERVKALPRDPFDDLPPTWKVNEDEVYFCRGPQHTQEQLRFAFILSPYGLKYTLTELILMLHLPSEHHLYLYNAKRTPAGVFVVYEKKHRGTSVSYRFQNVV